MTATTTTGMNTLTRPTNLLLNSLPAVMTMVTITAMTTAMTTEKARGTGISRNRKEGRNREISSPSHPCNRADQLPQPESCGSFLSWDPASQLEEFAISAVNCVDLATP